jgi:hypothetical protein
MTLKEMVKDKMVRFVYYRDGELIYITEDGFEFVVPISDAGTGTFKAEDKAIFFMRWIRKQVEEQASWERQKYNETNTRNPLYQEAWDKLRSGGGPGSTCNKEEWETSIEDYSSKNFGTRGTEIEKLPEGEDLPMSPELHARLINSIIHARVDESKVERFEDGEL